MSNAGRSHSGSGEVGERPVMTAAGSARSFDASAMRSESGGIGGSRGGCGSGRFNEGLEFYYYWYSQRNSMLR